MDGPQLKRILISKNYLLKDVAAKLGLSQPNFSQVVKAQDVKSGTLENICDALGVKMDFFYEGTRFAPATTVSSSEPTVDSDDNMERKILFLQGQLAAMKEAYQALVDKMSNASTSNLRQAANE